jgi:predicted secreted protein
MTLTGGIVLFVILWWLAFFLVLPWGIRRAGDEELGHDAGAPINPRLWLRASVATAISVVLFAAVFWFVETQELSFR